MLPLSTQYIAQCLTHGRIIRKEREGGREERGREKREEGREGGNEPQLRGSLLPRTTGR